MERYSTPYLKPNRAPITRCLICDEWIYPQDDYTFFAEEYGHVSCIAFHRLQVAMFRAAFDKE